MRVQLCCLSPGNATLSCTSQNPPSFRRNSFVASPLQSHRRFLQRHNGCRLIAIRASPLDPEALTDRGVSILELQRQLDAAIDEENYSAAAQLRDEIERRRFDSRLAVEEANTAFYAAFSSGSLKAMSEIWGAGEHVQCIHPRSGCIAGRQSVLESWKLVLGSGRLSIELQDVRIYATESWGYVTCVELMDAGDSRGRVVATNVFEKQSGKDGVAAKWKIVHHHGG